MKKGERIGYVVYAGKQEVGKGDVSCYLAQGSSSTFIVYNIEEAKVFFEKGSAKCCANNFNKYSYYQEDLDFEIIKVNLYVHEVGSGES